MLRADDYPNLSFGAWTKIGDVLNRRGTLVNSHFRVMLKADLDNELANRDITNEDDEDDEPADEPKKKKKKTSDIFFSGGHSSSGEHSLGMFNYQPNRRSSGEHSQGMFNYRPNQHIYFDLDGNHSIYPQLDYNNEDIMSPFPRED